LKLSCTIDAEMPRNLIGDQDRIRQVLLNLLSNAIKFTEEGLVELAVSLLSKSDREVALRFQVVDTGIGIPEDLKARLFQRFSQGDNAAGRRYGGAGLGLAISKELAEGMGGRIHFSSVPSGGSRFDFELPLARPAATPEMTRDEPSESTGDLGFLRDSRILAADDVPLNLYVLEQILKDAGSLVDLAVSGRDAVAKAVANPYDLILMDINMPGMDGIAATRAIRGHHDAAIATTPIIGVTASVLPSEREMYIAQGMNDVLSKPFTSVELITVLRKNLTSGEARGRQGETPATTPATPASLLDQRRLATLREDVGEQVQGDLIKQFSELGRAYLADARQALKKGDTEDLCAHLHRLRGMAAMIGCERLSDTAGTLEQRLKEGGLESVAEPDLEEIVELFEQSAEALGEHTRGPGRE
jgi:CheY-like chemotaxis protein/HPt (histidine-containing phosphotransfer) domain-containing protein